MRLIFTAPIEIDETAQMFKDYLKNTHEAYGIHERTLATFLQVDAREIRKIAERFNKRKYIGHDNTIKYHKHKHLYKRVDKDTDRATKELGTRKWDFIATLKTYQIYLEDFGKSEDTNHTLQIDMLTQLTELMEAQNE